MTPDFQHLLDRPAAQLQRMETRDLLDLRAEARHRRDFGLAESCAREVERRDRLIYGDRAPRRPWHAPPVNRWRSGGMS